MQLAQLSAEEREFLCGPAAEDEALISGFAARLAAVLSARTRQQVRVQAAAGLDTPEAAGSDLRLAWDGALDALWLCGRLGGSAGVAVSSALRASLQRTLQLALAEVWLSQRPPRLPAQLSFEILSGARRARLDVFFPASVAAMKLWAVHTIRHAE